MIHGSIGITTTPWAIAVTAFSMSTSEKADRIFHNIVMSWKDSKYSKESPSLRHYYSLYYTYNIHHQLLTEL